MEKYYYVSDRIIGVYFHSEKALKDYYKRGTKLEGLSCGEITTFQTSGGLNEYIERNKTHNNHIWNLG